MPRRTSPRSSAPYSSSFAPEKNPSSPKKPSTLLACSSSTSWRPLEFSPDGLPSPISPSDTERLFPLSDPDLDPDSGQRLTFAPPVLFYGLAYAPARFCQPHFNRNLHRLAEYFINHWQDILHTSPPSLAVVASLLHGWRFVFHTTSPADFPPDLIPQNTSTPLSLYTAALQQLPSPSQETPSSSPRNSSARRTLRHFLQLLQEESRQVYEVPNGVLAPYLPTVFTRYYLSPPFSDAYYYPVLFLVSGVERFSVSPPPAHTLSLLVGADCVRFSPAAILAVAPPETGACLEGRHSLLCEQLITPFLPPQTTFSPPQMNLFNTKTALSSTSRPLSSPSPGRFQQLFTALHELTSQPERWSYDLPRRDASGRVLPPPRWVAEHLTAVALQKEQNCYHAPEIGLSAAMQPQWGAVAINAEYIQYFSTPTPIRSDRYNPEPWTVMTPPGPLRTFAQLVDQSVWEGRPDVLQSLLHVYTPAELRHQLSPLVWERWHTTAFWAARTLEHRDLRLPLIRYHQIKSTGTYADCFQLLRNIWPELSPEHTVYLHTCQIATLAREFEQRQQPAAAQMWRERFLERHLTPPAFSHRAGVLEAALQLEDYLHRHAPLAFRRRHDGWTVNPAILTPPYLHRLESLVLGTRYEGLYAQLLSGFLEHLSARSQAVASVLTGFFGNLPDCPPDTSAHTLRHLGLHGVFPALDDMLWGETAAALLPDFLVARLSPREPAHFRDGFAAYIWKLHLQQASLHSALKYENEAIRRLHTLEYHSTLNTVLMALGSLDLMSQSQRIRHQWLDELSQALTTSDASTLQRLVLLSPLIPLRHPDWPRLCYRFCQMNVSSVSSLAQEFHQAIAAERSLGMVEVQVRTEHLPFGEYHPHHWLSHHRPQTYRLSGYLSSSSSSAFSFPAYRHYAMIPSR